MFIDNSGKISVTDDLSFSLYNHSAKGFRDDDESRRQVNLSFSSPRDPRFAQLSVMKHVCGVYILETAE